MTECGEVSMLQTDVWMTKEVIADMFGLPEALIFRTIRSIYKKSELYQHETEWQQRPERPARYALQERRLYFKASQIRRGLSLATIMSKLNSNAEKEQQRTINSQARQIQTEQPREETRSERQERNEPSIGIPSLGLFDTTNPVYDPAEEEFRRRMQKKKKKRGPRL